MSDTICAICTSLGVGAISIIRVSGEDSFKIVSKIFTKDLTKLPDHTINYGFIKYNDELIDEVLVSVMKAPNTYTKEDIVEINCHGGIASTNKILEILLECGCRLATPGEFTKRAYLNGRIDISQAQAVNDLLYSKTNNARKVFMNGLTGLLNKKIETIRKEILDLISNIEVPGASWLLGVCMLSENMIILGSYSKIIYQWKIEGNNLIFISKKTMHIMTK